LDRGYRREERDAAQENPSIIVSHDVVVLVRFGDRIAVVVTE
jgi:hypothetical protein